LGRKGAGKKAGRTKKLKKIEKYKKYNFDDLESEIKSWNDKILERTKEMEQQEGWQQRDKFVKMFPLNEVNQIPIDKYVPGKVPKDKTTFSYMVEHGTRKFGTITGRTSAGGLFGVYVNQKTQEYEFHKEYTSAEEEYPILIQKIYDMLQIAKDVNSKNYYEKVSGFLAKNSKRWLSVVAVNKILRLYFPDKFLQSYSYVYVNGTLERLKISQNGLDDTPADHIKKQKLILDYRNNHPIMKNWSNRYYNHFLMTMNGYYDAKNAEENLEKYWLWSCIPEHWKIVKKDNVWATGTEKVREFVRRGDRFVFYVSGTDNIKGIFECEGDWYKPTNSPFGLLDEYKQTTFQSQIDLKQLKLGSFDLKEFAGDLEFLGKKELVNNKFTKEQALCLKGQGALPANKRQPLSFADFQLIEENLVSDLDDLVEDWLTITARQKNMSIDEFVQQYAREEIKNREDKYSEIQAALVPKIDVDAFSKAQRECWTLRGQAISSKIDKFLKDPKGSEALEMLVNDFPDDTNQRQVAIRINDFIAKANEIGFYNTTRPGYEASSSALFASVILTSLYPERFVDYRKIRWQKFAGKFGKEIPQNFDYGNQLIWAGWFAEEFCNTTTFKKYWKNNIKPSWTLSAICWKMREETDDQAISEPDVIDRILNEDFPLALKPELVKKILNILEIGKDVILVGAPGVGKTALVTRILGYRSNLLGKGVPVIAVAHADWTRRDLIGGLSLDNTEFSRGKMLEAIEDDKLLLIDEFNRADINKAFGEMFYAREYGSIRLSEDEGKIHPPRTIEIPEDFQFMGTMNDFDKNLLLTELSYGLITRLAFVEVEPAIEKEEEAVKGQIDDTTNYEEMQKQITGYYDFINQVREERMIGVRTSLDIIKYLLQAFTYSQNETEHWKNLDVALCVFLEPQFDRLDINLIDHVLKSSKTHFADNITDFNKQLEKKKKSLKGMMSLMSESQENES